MNIIRWPQGTHLMVLIALALVGSGCGSDGSGVDRLFDADRDVVEVPVDVDLGISILSPSQDGAPAGYTKKLSGTCGTPGKVVEVLGGATGFGICALDRTWEVEVNLEGQPAGSVAVQVRMVDDGTYGNSATRVLNKISTACDTASARGLTFANMGSGGDGAGTPYIVCNATQFSNIRNYLGANIEIHNDINFGSTVFTPIGTYTGVLEGNRFELANYNIVYNGERAGLFRQADNATFKNLVIRNVNVTASFRAAALVGFTQGNVTMENIHLYSIAIQTTHATNGESGALVGYIYIPGDVRIENCSVTAVDIQTGNTVGGLIGRINNATTVNLNNLHVYSGSVLGIGNVGGLMGYTDEPDLVGSSLYVTASVNGSADDIGGLFGEGRGTLTDVGANAVVNRQTAGNRVGGLIGYFVGSASSLRGTAAVVTRASGDPLPTKCYATGVVIGGTASRVGGLIGHNEADLVESCYATGLVDSDGSYIGGLIGDHRGNLLSDSFASGSVTGTGDYIGGLVGEGTAATQEIRDSFATGNVTNNGLSPNYVGGLVGSFGGNIGIFRSYATGNVHITSADVADGNMEYFGGLAGYLSSAASTIEDSYATGHVTMDIVVGAPGGTNYWRVGGLVGSNQGSANNVYATGNVSITSGVMQQVAGLIGRANNQVVDSYATGDVTSGTLYVGGLIGYASSTVNVIRNSYAEGAVEGSNTYVGGLVGRFEGDVIEDSYALGDVTSYGSSSIGGLVGDFSANGLSIINSYASGNVLALAANPSFVGGLVGNFNGTTLIDGSRSTGYVFVPNGDLSVGNIEYIGGLIGRQQHTGADVTNSYSTGGVTINAAPGASLAQYVGGLIGASFGDTSGSRAEADVRADLFTRVGGLIGYQGQNRSISTSHALGHVTGGQRVGGLVGETQNTGVSVSDSYARGDVNALSSGYAGGLVGLSNGNIHRSYASGDVNSSGDYTGGLEGGSETDNRFIQYNFATGDVNAGTSIYVGGLSGKLDTGTNRFTNNFATGNVRGGEHVGGLVGRFIRLSVSGMQRNYAFGQVTRATGGAGADSTFGPLVGSTNNNDGILNGSNFYLSSVMPKDEATNSAIASPFLTNCTGLGDLSVEGNFSPPFDFTSDWEPLANGPYTLPGYGLYIYPVHQWWTP